KVHLARATSAPAAASSSSSSLCAGESPASFLLLDEAELLLNLEQYAPEEERGGEQGEREEWAVQRLRLSPSEKHLAATVKSSHGEQANVFVEVALSRDGRIITINSNSKINSEVLKAPLAGPSLGSWVPVHTPSPGVTLKDMEVLGDHCVLTCRDSSGELALTAVPLAEPVGAYNIPIPQWACSCESRRPGPADPCGELRFLLSSPAYPQVPYSFYPRDRLLLSAMDAGGTSPESGSGDVLGTMAAGDLPLTVEEREEWGDPAAEPRHRLAIASYCPLHNIAPQCYPSMLLTAYSNDGRVPLARVIRYAEKVKEAVHTHFTALHGAECAGAPSVVLNIQPGADHFGPNLFDLMLEESALQLAFLYTELGLDPPTPPPPRRRRRHP
ncbi:hypothetical protein CRUP_000548, partial [Coryphaenoides rupestris]